METLLRIKNLVVNFYTYRGVVKALDGIDLTIHRRDGFDYYVYHCRDEDQSYEGLHRLVSGGRPVIVAHPMVTGTDLSRVARDCLVEINNRYVWRGDFRRYYAPFVESRRFVVSSDAHQPHWLAQSVARHVAQSLGVRETTVFGDAAGDSGDPPSVGAPRRC